ncbi:MAG: hypothetical protein F2836_05325, partial [Actinobacteria bacterium]|nr:hypothetical protein [Actinomycetota bacterium]
MVISLSLRAEYESLGEYLEATLDPADRERVGLISFNHWRFALGAVAETALEFASTGSEVTIGFWADETPLPDTGWTTSRTVAHLVGSRTRDQVTEQALIAKGLPKSAFARPPIRHWRPTDMPPLPSPLTRSRLRELLYDGSGMGRSVLQVHPDFNTPIRESHVWPRRWVKRAMKSYAWAYDQALALIRERNLGTVVVYNGRFTHDRAVAAAAERAGIRVLYYDTGGYGTHFDLTEATTHDWAHLQGRMHTMYGQWDPSDRDVIGASWFTNRQTHADEGLRVFVASQTLGHVVDLPEADTLVVFFSSSGDEIAELELDWSQYQGSQEQALKALADACRAKPGCALVVRTHPHMRLKPPADLEDWNTAVAAAAPDLHIDPNSPADSYELMRRADIVFTYGSTSGVESAFIGKPVA